MKLLIGDGQKVTVRDVSEPLYEIEGEYLGFHGFQIMEDDDARKEIVALKTIGKGRNLTK